MTATSRMKYVMARKMLCYIENYCYSSDDVCVCVCLRAHTHIQTDTETYIDNIRQFAFRKHYF